jgi:hypothetical protein
MNARNIHLLIVFIPGVTLAGLITASASEEVGETRCFLVGDL